MTEDQPATEAGPRIPRQRRPSRHTNPETTDSPHPVSKTKTDLAIEEAVARLIANAPPLSPEQRTRLAELFSINKNRTSR